MAAGSYLRGGIVHGKAGRVQWQKYGIAGGSPARQALERALIRVISCVADKVGAGAGIAIGGVRRDECCVCYGVRAGQACIRERLLNYCSIIASIAVEGYWVGR